MKMTLFVFALAAAVSVMSCTSNKTPEPQATTTTIPTVVTIVPMPGTSTTIDPNQTGVIVLSDDVCPPKPGFFPYRDGQSCKLGMHVCSDGVNYDCVRPIGVWCKTKPMPCPSPMPPQREDMTGQPCLILDTVRGCGTGVVICQASCNGALNFFKTLLL